MAALISGATALTVLAIAIPLVSSGDLNGLYLGLVVLVTIAAFEAVQGLPQSLQQLPPAAASARRTFELLDSTAEIEDTAMLLNEQVSPPVVLDHVAFSYPGGSAVWQDLNLTISTGRCVAITGASGSGKSTILNLLLRFWDYQAGAITFAEQDARRLPPRPRGRHSRLSPRTFTCFTPRSETTCSSRPVVRRTTRWRGVPGCPVR